MKIAIATFADLPSPPVKGGAVETLIDIICQINEKKKKIILKSAIVIGLLIFIIIVIQLYSYTKQISKSNLNNVLEQAQQNQEIYIKIQELEERVNELEKNVSH